MEPLTLKLWLRRSGVLAEYLRRRIDHLASGNYFRLEGRDPRTWIGMAFPPTLADHGKWNRLGDDWRRDVKVYPGEKEPGMPLDDPLGLALALAELEE